MFIIQRYISRREPFMRIYWLHFEKSGEIRVRDSCERKKSLAPNYSAIVKHLFKKRVLSIMFWSMPHKVLVSAVSH